MAKSWGNFKRNNMKRKIKIALVISVITWFLGALAFSGIAGWR